MTSKVKSYFHYKSSPFCIHVAGMESFSFDHVDEELKRCHLLNEWIVDLFSLQLLTNESTKRLRLFIRAESFYMNSNPVNSQSDLDFHSVNFNLV